jgi:uncharacterized protein YkwD
MRARLLTLSLLLATLSHAVPPSPRRLPQIEVETYRATNQERVRHGLTELPLDPALSEVARAHSQDMARRKYFGHVSPEGASVAERVDGRGLAWELVGENIHSNDHPNDIIRVAVRSWMESDSHRKTLLDPRYERTGMGCAVDDRGVVYFTQLFLKPPPASP